LHFHAPATESDAVNFIYRIKTPARGWSIMHVGMEVTDLSLSFVPEANTASPAT
jgi:hypothetical protein